MASRKLRTNVAVDGTWYGPDSDVPAEVAKRITNPKVWSDGGTMTAAAPTGDDPAAKEPPRGGPGSGVDAWKAHADYLGVTYDEKASAKDIAALVDENKKAQG